MKTRTQFAFFATVVVAASVQPGIAQQRSATPTAAPGRGAAQAAPIRSPEVRQPFTAFTDVAADAKKVNASLKLLWTGCGRDDGLFTPNKD